MSQAKVRSEEWPLELTAKQNEATALFEENEGADGKSSKGAGNAVKAHTEAGKKRLVNLLLGLAATQATEGGFKITPADLIRLMQLHKELNPQKDRKVTVQWIEDRPE